MNNGDPRFPSSRFLRVACVIVPKGSPPPREWIAAHPQNLRISGYYAPPPPPEPNMGLEPQPGATGQAEPSPETPVYKVVIDYAGKWTIRPVEPLTPQAAPWTEPPPAWPKAPESDVEPEPRPPRLDYLRDVPPPGPRPTPARPPHLDSRDAIASGMNFAMELCSAAGMRRLMRQVGQHLAAHKGDVHAATAAAKATIANGEDEASGTVRRAGVAAHRKASLIKVQAVTFGHGDRHVADPETARSEILQSLPQFEQVVGPFWGMTPNFIYRAYPLPGGRLHIGTYYER